jgi:hypothetical protein
LEIVQWIVFAAPFCNQEIPMAIATPSRPPATDPNTVPEVFCAGPINLSIVGNFATLTFSHVRKSVADTFGDDSPTTRESVIRARVVIPIEGLMELKDMLGRVQRQRPAQSQEVSPAPERGIF